MQIHIRADHIKINDFQRGYIENKLSALQKYSERIASEDESVQVWVNVEKNETLGQDRKIVMRVSMAAPKATFRAEVNALSVEEGIDSVHDKLIRQIERYKAKHMHSQSITTEDLAKLMSGGKPGESDVDGKDLRITRKKLFSDLVPMTEAEAINQMEMLGHTFFIFVNSLTDRYNVVYMRPDGASYGLVELENQEGITGV
jgi:putative sigma-54 modulation protein